MPASAVVPPITFAHRGARTEEPENTLPAFRRALELGATGLESDAWLAADGEVVLVHDPVAKRGLRRMKVASTTAERLATLGVPRLADLYAECGTAFELSLDVKDPAAAIPIVEVARAAGPDVPGRLWLCLGGLGTLRDLRAAASDARLVHSPGRGRIQPAAMERHAADLAAAGVDAINLHHTDWTKGLVSLFHRFDVRAFAWDTQEVRHIRAVLQMGVDAIYCDRTDRMVAAVGEWVADGTPGAGTA